MNTLAQTIEKMVSNSQYNEACELIVKEMNLDFKAKFVKNDFHFNGDNSTRDIYKITLTKDGRKYSFNFGQSLVNSSHYVQTFSNGKVEKFGLDGSPIQGNRRILDVQKYVNSYGEGELKPKLVKGSEPRLYNVLACLQKYGVGTFEDFCSEFGYDVDSRKAKKTYKAVVKEYDKICSLFSETDLEALREIQ